MVDVRAGLREAREGSEAPLYSAVNPHWSPYAAHVAWNQTLSCLAAVNPQLEGLPSLTPSGVSGVDAPNEYEALGAPPRRGRGRSPPTSRTRVASTFCSWRPATIWPTPPRAWPR